MRGYMFRNRWGAMLFVAFVLAGVTRLIGTEQTDGAIDVAAGQIVQQKAQVDALSLDSPPAPEPIEIEPTGDDELIDPATGEDPTPIEMDAGLPDGIVVESEVPEDLPVFAVPGRDGADHYPPLGM